MSDQISSATEDSENRYRAIFENSPVSIWEEDFSAIKSLFDRLRRENVSDIESYFEQHPEVVQQCAEQVKIIDVNQAALTLHHAKSKKELLAGLVNTFTPESFTAFREELVALWQGETAMSSDAVVRTLDGKPRHVTVNFVVCPGYEETLSKVFVSLIDITEHKQNEQALIDAELRLSRFIANLPAFFFTFRICANGKLCFPYASPGIKTLYGLEPEDVREDMAPLHMLAHPDDRQYIETSIAEAFKTHEPFHIEFRVCRPGMPQRWLECRSVAIPDSEGNPLWHGIMLDITERRQAVEALVESERNYHALADNLPDNIIRYDREGRATYLNPALEKLLGITAKDRIGKRIREFHTDNHYEAYAQAIDRVLATGEHLELEFILPDKNGNTSVYAMRMVPERNTEGEITGALTISHDITEQKHMEEMLRASEQRFHAIFDQSFQLIGLLSTDGTLLEANQAALELVGTDENEVLGKPFWETPWWSHSAELQQHLRAAVHEAATGQFVRFEATHPDQDGDIHTIDFSLKPVIDTDGRVIQLIPEGRDITERKQAAAALAASEQQFRSLAENSPDNIVRYNRQCRLIYYNPMMAQTVPFDAKTLLGKTPLELGFGSPELSTEYEDHVRRVLESGESSDMELTVPNAAGELRKHLVRFAAEQNEQGDVTGVIAIGRDITALKQAEEKILQSEQRLRLHTEMSPLGFLEWDENFCATEWNPACEKIFGYTREEALGRHATELILPPDVRELVNGIYHDLMNQTGGQHSTNENITKDGRTIIVEWFNTTLINKDGKPIGVASVCRDITELKQVEKEHQIYAEFLTNMDRINRAIQGADDLETMMRDVLDEVLDILNCDRAFLLYPCDPTAKSWTSPMERTRPEYPGVAELGLEIPMDDEVAATLRLLLDTSGVVKFTADSENRPPKDVSERFGIKSFMSVAVYPKVGKPWQFGIHQCSYDRIWTEEEEKLLEEIGKRLGDGLTSLLVLRDLRESEARYQRLFDTANEGIWIQDENFVTTFVNEHMANMLGYTVDELQGKKVTEFMTGEDVDAHASKMEERSRNISDIYERRMRHRDGSDVWMLISATPVFENDQFSGSFAMLTDITARKNAEMQLASSEQLFRTLVEHSPDYIVRYDRDLQRIYINPALQEQFSVSHEEAIGHSRPDASPVIDPARYMTHVRQAIETGSEYSDEHSYRKPDGEIRWASSRFIPEFDLEGKVATVMVISTDITERKRTEKELLDARLLFEGVIEQSPVPMALAKPTGELIFNKACADFLHTWDEPTLVPGVKLQEMKQPWKDYDAQGNLLNHMDLPLARALRGEIIRNIELQVVRKDGSRKWEMVTGSPIYDNEGNLIAGFVTFPDITERKEAEEALRIHKEHLEKTVTQRTEELRLARDAAETANKAKSTFLANMSHELRTPLNAILGFSRMMQQDESLSDAQHETLNIINNSGEHLLKLINDVLEIAKIEAGKVQLQIAAFDLHGLVREVADMMRLRAEQKGLQLELDQSSEFPRYIKGDEARMRQILVNLISNAVKFTETGTVTIRLAIKNNARHHLLIEIEDTGPGIGEEDQQRLFRPFVQLPEGAMHVGTGLGLSIVRQFVQLMGGTISVKSTLGNGALFRVTLPLDEADEREVDRLSGENHGEIIGLSPGQPTYRILIAEDQHDNQLLLSKLMTDIGMDVKVANNGEECIQVFNEWKPDLIWMDRLMPVMDGVEATRRIRKLSGGNKVKIVAVTASAFKEQQTELLAGGMDGFVRKPYRFSEIYDSLAQQLGLKFIYRDALSTDEHTHTSLSPERFSELDDDVRKVLRDALNTLDSERITAVINLIARQDPVLAQTLKQLANNYDYPTILSALDGA